jgi:hypothetical protein
MKIYTLTEQQHADWYSNQASVHDECRRNIMDICKSINAVEVYDIDGTVIMAF